MLMASDVRCLLCAAFWLMAKSLTEKISWYLCGSPGELCCQANAESSAPSGSHSVNLNVYYVLYMCSCLVCSLPLPLEGDDNDCADDTKFPFKWIAAAKWNEKFRTAHSRKHILRLEAASDPKPDPAEEGLRLKDGGASWQHAEPRGMNRHGALCASVLLWQVQQAEGRLPFLAAN